MLDIQYRIPAAVLFVTSLVISAAYRRRADRQGGTVSAKEEGSPILVLRTIFGMALWFSSLAYLLNPRWMAWASLQLAEWVRWLGVVVMAICVPLIYWVFSSLGENITPTIVLRQEHRLVTSGPYRWVRHPLYTVGFLNFLGLALLAANWFIALVLLLGFVVLGTRTRLEEARLIGQFGDAYRSYMQSTGQYLPRIRM